jgi:hypothetical protein
MVKERIKSKTPLPKQYKDFALNEDDQLVYTPLNLIVIPKSEVEDVLTKLYKDDVNMLAKGIRNVYKYVSSKFINITRKDIENFLLKQKDFQLTKNITKVVNKPIIERVPNNRWQVDNIDMSKYSKNNAGKKYIFNCVDVFSRKIWLRALKNLEAKTTTEAIKSIINEAGVKPSVIQCDNGIEFQGNFKEYLKKNGITQIFNNAYSPNENAIVERSNKEVRKIIRTLMLAENSFKWYNKLDQVQEHRNRGYNETIKVYPDQVWTADKTNKIDTKSDKFKASINLAERAIKSIKKYRKLDNFKVDQKVRVKMSAIFNNIRKLLKEGNSKQIVVSYTPDVFSVEKIIRGSGVLERKKYVLKNEEGNVVTKSDGKIKYFYASDLIPFNDGEESNITMERALELNKVEPNQNDAIY